MKRKVQNWKTGLIIVIVVALIIVIGVAVILSIFSVSYTKSTEQYLQPGQATICKFFNGCGYAYQVTSSTGTFRVYGNLFTNKVFVCPYTWMIPNSNTEAQVVKCVVAPVG